MKKFILPLMLLLIVGSLLAVESDPSAVVGYVKYDLVAGNNTIAVPMEQGLALASAVGDAVGATTVAYFNASTQAWESINESPFGGWSDDFAVSNGQALWIYIDSPGSFYSIGDLPATEPTYALLEGNNTIMVPLNKSDLTGAALVGDDIGATTVANFNASTQAWESINESPFGGWSDDFATSIGDPLWIYTDAAGTWPSRAIRTMSVKGTK